MSLRLLLIAAPAAALLLAACASPMATAASYPHTRTVAQVDTYHGTAVPGPFCRLEDDNADDTKAWVQAQNAATDRYLAALPQREPVRRIYTSLDDFEKIGVPTREGGRWFWTRHSGLQPQPDRLDWVKFSSAKWTPDGRGFFYSRYAESRPGMASAWLRPQVLGEVLPANGEKQHRRQIALAADIAARIAAGERRITGLMIESHLLEGQRALRPGDPLLPGASITDAPISWDDTAGVRQRRLGAAA